MDLLFLLLVLAVIYKLSIVKPITSINDSYLSTHNFNQLRGLFCICVVFHHLSQITQGGLVFRYFTLVGYLTVAIFYFISGFGLIKQYITRENYLSSFLLKRVKTLVIPYLIFNLIYFLFSYTTTNPYSFIDVVQSWINGEPIVLYSWYVIDLMCMYIVFYFSAKFLKNPRFVILCEILFCIVMTFVWHRLGYGKWWFKSNFAFVTGMIWALYESQIDAFFSRHKNYLVILGVVFIAFIMLFACAYNIPNKFLSLMCFFASATVFPILVIMLTQKLCLNSPILNFLGTISMEIYLIHGLFCSLFSSMITTNNEMLYALVIIACSIIGALFLKFIFIKLKLK